MESKIKISVVIAYFNQEKELKIVLQSFLEQSMPHEDFELIVIDDGSSNYLARKIVKEILEQYPSGQVIYVRNYRNDEGKYGSSAQVKNIGIRLAKGLYVYFNNAEIVQVGDSLEYLYKQISNSYIPLCIRGRIMDVPFDEIENKTPKEREEIYKKLDPSRERVASADHAGLACVRRDIIYSVGGNDERFDYWGKEDIDLASRLKRFGVKYIYDTELKSFHIHHEANYIKKGDYYRMCTLLEENNKEERVIANLGSLWGNLNFPTSTVLKGSVVIEGAANQADLSTRLHDVYYCNEAHSYEIIVVCLEIHRNQVEHTIYKNYRTIPIISLSSNDANNHVERLTRKISTEKMIFLPEGSRFASPNWCSINLLTQWSPMISVTNLPERTAQNHPISVIGWLCYLKFFQAVFLNLMLPEWNLFNLINQSNSNATLLVPEKSNNRKSNNKTKLNLKENIQILTLIPHYNNNFYLKQCLDSITSQTRLSEGIVVIDDHSCNLPYFILNQYPSITLMKTQLKVNVGPYRLIQQMVDDTNYDAYLIQDADDFSAPNRLEILIKKWLETGAELISSQEITIDEVKKTAYPICYPLNVNEALRDKPGHPLLHPGSLIFKSLITACGGFASGLKFGADSEFLLRAAYCGKIVNVSEYCYFKREHINSLTTSKQTGFKSKARKDLIRQIKSNALRNIEFTKNNLPPNLTPMKKGEKIVLEYVGGPRLNFKSDS